MLFADCVRIGSSIERSYWCVCDYVHTIAQHCSFVVTSDTSIQMAVRVNVVTLLTYEPAQGCVVFHRVQQVYITGACLYNWFRLSAV